MVNYRTVFFSLIFLAVTLSQSTAQTKKTNSLKNTKFAPAVRFNGSGFVLGSSNTYASRHSTFMYNGLKTDGLTVVSVHQPGTTFDNVYYVNNAGMTEYESSANTGPQNFHGGIKGTHYDSFNPYGSEDFYEGVVNGLANLLNSRLFRKR